MTTQVEALPVTRQIPVARSLGEEPPLLRVWDRLSALIAPIVCGTAIALYVVAFCAISLQQYRAYVPHALDLGNMTQAFWNTVHGYPFRFQNMRAPIQVEAFGTSTRLSFHVEPIIPFLAVVYAIWQHVETLLIMQTVAIASGAIPVWLFARRRLGHPLAEIAFPVAYLLFPAVEAANLYEFHPVSFAVPFLLWAFYFADCRRYTLFALMAFGALGCKEEMGLLVALIGLWIAVRNGERQFGLIVAVLGAAWSATALFVVVPHFQAGRPSSYWGRYLPPGWPGTHYPVDQAQVRRFWLQHPGQVWTNLTDEAKRSYLHRILDPVGYLALLSPATLVIAIPSLLLILLSYEPHMYGGLAHYSAELVPIMIVGAILGTEWLARVVAPKIRVRGTWMIVACCVWVLFAAAVNHRVNGLSPLAESFVYPAISAHDRLLDQAIAMIPPTAAVSAQDTLNPHLSDREQIFLYPDTDNGKVQYILLDATQSTGSTMRPCDLPVLVTGRLSACEIAAGPATPMPRRTSRIDSYALLPSHKWNILFAEDGILLLKRRLRGQPSIHVLPPAFFTFAHPQPGDAPRKLVARFGNVLELEGYSVDRVERTNLRNPDIILTTWWKVLAPPPPDSQIMHYLSDPTGALQFFSDDQETTDWFPIDRWKAGETYKVTSKQLTVTTNTSGHIDIDLGITTNDAKYQEIAYNLPVTLISGAPAAHGVAPDQRGINRILRVTSIMAHL